MTALHFAACHNQVEAARLILTHKDFTEVNAKSTVR
jgi:hypothetical protein